MNTILKNPKLPFAPIFAAVICFLPMVSDCLAGEDQRWHVQGMRLSSEVRQVLMDAGQCSSADDCARGKYFFFRSTSQGLEASLYGVTDRAVISTLLGKLASMLVSEKMVSASLSVYEYSKKVEMDRAGLFGERESMKFTIGGSYVGSYR